MAFYQDPRQAFGDALEKLLVVKKFEDVTVNDIVQAASSSRSTFYRYFKDKYDLMSWIYVKLVKMAEAQTEGNSFYALSVNLCRLYKTRPLFFKRIWAFNGQNSFQEFFFNYTVEFELRQIRRVMHTKEVPEDLAYAVNFYVAGIQRLIRTWVLDGMLESPEFVAETCVNLCPKELSKYLDGHCG